MPASQPRACWLAPLHSFICSIAAAAARWAAAVATTAAGGRTAAVAAPAATSSAAATTAAATATRDGHLHGVVLALAVVIRDLEGHAVSLLDAALPIQEAAGMDEQVRIAAVWLEEAEALVVIPPQHLPSARTAAAAAAADDVTAPEELNRLLARSEEELSTFAQMDAEILQPESGRDASLPLLVRCGRLMRDEEVPQGFRLEEADAEDED
mmetsp:Transcript_46713/g.123412  ORF Transcript_46713/g.123412 Transcript_46713/m.123412 type:complete len:211 (+) Transcript_46713:81-713(+)